MKNSARCRFKNQIHESAETLAVTIKQICVQEAGKTIKDCLIGHGRFSPDVHLLFCETAALIQSPDLPRHPKCGWTTDPPQKTVYRRVHPDHHTGAVIQSEITTDCVIQQIADQNLIR